VEPGLQGAASFCLLEPGAASKCIHLVILNSISHGVFDPEPHHFPVPKNELLLKNFFLKLLFEQEDVGSGGSMLEAYC
jgi:hypothetical protein